MALNLAGYISGLSVAGQAEQAARGRRYEQEARDRQEAFRLEQLKVAAQQPAATQPINQGVPQLPVLQIPQANKTIASVTPVAPPVAPPVNQRAAESARLARAIPTSTSHPAGFITAKPTPEPVVDPRARARAEEMLRFNEMRVAQLEQGLKNPNITATQRNTLKQQLTQFSGRVAENRRAISNFQGVEAFGYGTGTGVSTEAQRRTELERLSPPTTAPAAASQSLVNAMIHVESRGNPNAVSPVGARGLMQVMPATAMDPGFGLPSVFDFAQQIGVPVGKRTEAEAKRLLTDPTVGALYGQQYMEAMLNRYNGNLDYALAAYNWGPGNIDTWVAEGANFAKLPKETREYIPQVMAAMGQAPAIAAAPAPAPAPAQPAQPAPAQPAPAPAPAQPAPAQPTQPVQLAQAQTGTATDVTAGTTGPSNYYLANPQAIPGDMQRFMRQRDEIARMAGMYQRSGMGNEFTVARQKLQELDENMYYLQGMQGLQEFSLMNDPRRLSAVWSHFAGAPIGIQPRSDGKFDLIINGQRARQGLSAGEISQQARLSFDQPFRQQFATASAAQNMKTFETGLEIQKDNAKQLAQMIREVAVERLKGTNQQALEWYKANAGWDIKPTGAGDGTVIIRPPGQGAYLFNSSGRTIKIDNIEIQSNAAYPIAGLPTYGGMKP
jgi:hypothetical protein